MFISIEFIYLPKILFFDNRWVRQIGFNLKTGAPK